MDIMDKTLYLDIRYNLPLSKSPLYTTNGYYNSSAGSTSDNNLFGWSQVANANATAPQYPLNDFRMGFMMFKRLYDHAEGTGVGLYIVKRFVENAGGKIELVSELNKGSTFKVYFIIRNL